eukprot:278242_1
MSTKTDKVIDAVARRSQTLRELRSLDVALPFVSRSADISNAAHAYIHNPESQSITGRSALSKELETIQYNSKWATDATMETKANVETNRIYSKELSAKLLAYKKKAAVRAKSDNLKLSEFDERLAKTESDVRVLEKNAALNSRNVVANRLQTNRLQQNVEKEFKVLKDRIHKLEVEVQKTKRGSACKVVDDDVSEETTLASRFYSALGFSDK